MIPLYLGSLFSLGLILWAIMAVRSDYANYQILTNFTTILVWVAYLFHASVVLLAVSLNEWMLMLQKRLAISMGSILILIGVTIIIIAIFNFHTFKRMSGLQTDQLISDGIYAWSRNPQNLGWGMTLIGSALIGRSGFALLLTILFG